MKDWVEPEIKELGSASELIKGFFAGKEVGGNDGLQSPEGNPVS